MSSNELPPLQELITLSDEQFYLKAADYLLSDTFGSGPFSGPHRMEIARKWLTKLLEETQSEICNSPKIMAFMDKESDLEILGKILLDGLLSTHSPVPATFLTAHVLRMGLRKFCSEETKIDQ